MDAQTQLVWATTLFFAGIVVTQVGLIASINAKKGFKNRSFTQTATEKSLWAIGFLVSAFWLAVAALWRLLNQIWFTIKFYLIIWILLGPATLLATRGPELYQTIDVRYTQYVAPWIQQGLLPYLNALRLTWDVTQCWFAVTPFAVSEFFVEWVRTLAFCVAVNYQELVDDGLNVFTTFYNATLDFVYDVGRSDFNGEAVAVAATAIVNDTLRPAFECACSNTTFMTDILTDALTSRNLTAFWGYFMNLPIEAVRIPVTFVLDIFDNVFLDGNEFTCSGLDDQDYIDCQLERPPKFGHFAELGCQAVYSFGAWVDSILLDIYSAFFDQLGTSIALAGDLDPAAVGAFINGTVPAVSWVVTAPVCFLLRIGNTTNDLIVHADLVLIPKMNPSYLAYSQFVQAGDELYVNTTNGIQQFISKLAGFVPAAYSPVDPVVFQESARALGSFLRTFIRIVQFLVYTIQVFLAFIQDLGGTRQFFTAEDPFGGPGIRFIDTQTYFYDTIYDDFHEFINASVAVAEYWSEWLPQAFGYLLRAGEEFGTAFVQGITHIDDFPDWYCTDFQLREDRINSNLFKFSACMGNVIRTLPGTFGISTSCAAIAIPGSDVTSPIPFLPFPTETDPFCCLGGLTQSLIDVVINTIKAIFNLFHSALKTFNPAQCGSTSVSANIISLESSVAEIMDTLMEVLFSWACALKVPVGDMGCIDGTPGGMAAVIGTFTETIIYATLVFPRILLDILRVALYVSSTIDGPLVTDSRAMETCGAMSESYRLSVGFVLNVSNAFARLGDCVVAGGGTPIFGFVMEPVTAILGEGGILLQCISTPAGVTPMFQDPYCTDLAGVRAGTRMCIGLVLIEPILTFIGETLESGFGIFVAIWNLVYDLVVEFVQCAFNIFQNLILNSVVWQLRNFIDTIRWSFNALQNIFARILACFQEIEFDISISSFGSFQIFNFGACLVDGMISGTVPSSPISWDYTTFLNSIPDSCPAIAQIINTASVSTYNKRSDTDKPPIDIWSKLFEDLQEETEEFITRENPYANLTTPNMKFMEFFVVDSEEFLNISERYPKSEEVVFEQFHVVERNTWRKDKRNVGLTLINLIDDQYLAFYMNHFGHTHEDPSISQCRESFRFLQSLQNDPHFMNHTVRTLGTQRVKESIERMVKEVMDCAVASVVAQLINSDAAMFDHHDRYLPILEARGSSYSSYFKIAFLVAEGIQIFFQHWLPHELPKLYHLFMDPYTLHETSILIPRDESWVIYARSTAWLMDKPEVVFVGDFLERLLQHFFILVHNIKTIFHNHPVWKHVMDMAQETAVQVFDPEKGLISALYNTPNRVQEAKQRFAKRTLQDPDSVSIFSIAMENWDQMLVDAHLKETYRRGREERAAWEEYLQTKSIDEQYREAHPFRKMKIVFNEIVGGVGRFVQNMTQVAHMHMKAYSEETIHNRRIFPLMFDYIAERTLSPRREIYARQRRVDVSLARTQKSNIAVLKRHHGRLGDVPSYISGRTLRYHILLDHENATAPPQMRKRSIFEEDPFDRDIKIEYFDEPYRPLRTTRREQVIQEYYAETIITPEDVIKGNKSKQELWAEEICVNLPSAEQQEKCADLQCPIIVNPVVDIVAYICSCINITADGINVVIGAFSIEEQKIMLNRLWGYQFSTGDPEYDELHLDPDHKLLEPVRFGNMHMTDWRKYSSKYVYYMRGHYDKLTPEQQAAQRRQTFWARAFSFLKPSTPPKSDYILLDEFRKKRQETNELFNGKPLPLSKVNPANNDQQVHIAERDSSVKTAKRHAITPPPFSPVGFNLVNWLADIFNAFASWLTGRDVNIQNTFISFLNFLIDSASESKDSLLFWGSFLLLPDCFVQNDCRTASEGFGLWIGVGFSILIAGLTLFTLTIYNIDLALSKTQWFEIFALLALALAYRWSPVCLLTGWYPYCSSNWLGAPWFLPWFPLCYMGGIPNCVADDIYGSITAWDRACINWDNHLPGLFPDGGGECPCIGDLNPGASPSFDSCKRDIIPFNDEPYGFNDGLRNIFVTIEIYLPSVNEFLRTTSIIFFSWVRQVSWINRQLTFDFPSGEVPDAYVSANWVTLPLAVIGFVSLIFFLAVLFYLVAILGFLILGFFLLFIQFMILFTNWVMNKTGGYAQDRLGGIRRQTERHPKTLDDLGAQELNQRSLRNLFLTAEAAATRVPNFISSSLGGVSNSLQTYGQFVDRQLKKKRT